MSDPEMCPGCGTHEAVYGPEIMPGQPTYICPKVPKDQIFGFQRQMPGLTEEALLESFKVLEGDGGWAPYEATATEIDLSEIQDAR